MNKALSKDLLQREANILLEKNGFEVDSKVLDEWLDSGIEPLREIAKNQVFKILEIRWYREGKFVQKTEEEDYVTHSVPLVLYYEIQK